MTTDLTAIIFGRAVPIPREQAQKAAGTLAMLANVESLTGEERSLLSRAGDAITRLLWAEDGAA